jgi:hypothetical protein
LKNQNDGKHIAEIEYDPTIGYPRIIETKPAFIAVADAYGTELISSLKFN